MNFSEAIFYENYLTLDFSTTLLIQARLPTRQNGVENRDKAYNNRLPLKISGWLANPGGKNLKPIEEIS